MKKLVKKNIWLTCILAAVLFFSGVVAGYFGGMLLGPRGPRRFHGPPPGKRSFKEMIMNGMFGRLELSDKQKQEVSPAVDEWLVEMDNLHKKHQPQYLAVFNELFDKVSQVLTPEQKTELEKIREKVKKRHFFRKRRKFHKPEKGEMPPPPPPEKEEYHE